MTVNIRPNFAVDPFSDSPVHLSDAPRVDHANRAQPARSIRRGPSFTCRRSAMPPITRPEGRAMSAALAHEKDED
jgi:hypothetical protein